MLKSYCFRIITLLIVLLLQPAELALAATSQPVPSDIPREKLVYLNKAQSGSFSDALNSLAAQGHIAIIAEGVPFVPRLANKDIPDLTVATPLPQAVAKIAKSFDYNVQKQSNIFILTKRYTDPKELPCVTIEECRQAFGDIVTLLEKYDPKFDESSEENSQRSTVLTFFKSLSMAQIKEANTKTLRYGELTPDQQETVRRLFLYGFVQFPLQALRDTVDILDYAPRSVITGKDKDYTGLLIQAPVSSNKALLYYRSLDSKGKVVFSSLPKTPMILPRPAVATLSPLAEPMTLGSVVGLLTHTGPPPTVDTALKDKPLSVAGLANVPTMDVLHAMKVLYGLRISVSENGGAKLTRQILPVADTLPDLTQNVWGLLPVSLARVLHQEDAFPILGQIESSDEAMLRFQKSLQAQNLLTTLWSEADYQVLVGVQSQFRQQGISAQVPVKTLDQATRSALAIALSVSALKELQDGFTGQVTQNVMDCLEDMDNILVYTIPTEATVIHGQTIPSIYFEGTNPYTKQQIGLGGVRFAVSM